MRRRCARALLATALAVLTFSTAALAAEDASPASTPPPVRGDLHVRSHRVTVVLNNGFATTTVEQVLANPSAQDVAAEWTFPLPKDGSLSELALWVGEEMVVGEVVEKERARTVFAAEQQAGNDAGLMEQDGFHQYRLALARVPSGGEARVRIVYYQPLDIDAGVGRYLYPLTEGNTDDCKRSFWTMAKEADGELVFDVTLKTAFPVDGLHCPTHPGLQAEALDAQTWHATWAAPGGSLEEDFVLYYRLRPDVPARVELLTHRRPGEAEGTFMAVVTPGSDLAPVVDGTDWVFVLDASGSMAGEKNRTLRRGVAEALRGLGARDRVRLIAFHQDARELTTGWTAATPSGVATLAPLVDALAADGSTNVFAALELAYACLDADRPCAVILVSDGAANTGPHEYRDFVSLARRHDVRLFTFVVGNGANERLLGDLATLSNGFAKSVSVHDEIGAHILLARDRMSHEALHGVTFRLDGAVSRHPQTLPSLYLGQQLVVLGRYDRTGPSTLQVGARRGGQPCVWTLPVDLPAVDESNPEIERLYALAAVADLEREAWLATGDAGEARDAIVDLAVRYSLVTDATSMVVVRPDRKDAWGIGEANARRRSSEQAAAGARAARGNAVATLTAGDPLAGAQAAHAPSRASGASSGQGGGAGAVGPWFVLPVAALGLLALRRRRRGGA